MFAGLSEHLEILSTSRIVDLERLLMRAERRKAVEGSS